MLICLKRCILMSCQVRPSTSHFFGFGKSGSSYSQYLDWIGRFDGSHGITGIDWSFKSRIVDNGGDVTNLVDIEFGRDTWENILAICGCWTNDMSGTSLLLNVYNQWSHIFSDTTFILSTTGSQDRCDTIDAGSGGSSSRSVFSCDQDRNITAQLSGGGY